MTNSRRLLALLLVPIALMLAWLVFAKGVSTHRADAEQPGGGNSAQSHLAQAATSIIAAAKESVHAASSDEEAVNRANLSVKALRIIECW